MYSVRGPGGSEETSVIRVGGGGGTVVGGKAGAGCIIDKRT